MIRPKIGSARKRLVTIRSILSEVVSSPPAACLVQHSPIMEEIYVYRSLVIMLSVSSSISSSICAISAEISGTLCICSTILSSFSSNFTAKNRFCASGTSAPSLLSTEESTASTFCAKVCTGTDGFFADATRTALSAAAWIPLPFSAEISTTSQPSFFASFSTWILSPFFSTRSIMLTAITTGIPSSISCVLRYRFRSILVPSTIFRIASGFSLIR